MDCSAIVVTSVRLLYFSLAGLLSRIITAVLGAFVIMCLFMMLCVFTALENVPGGDGYRSNDSIKKAFDEITNKLGELNKNSK